MLADQERQRQEAVAAREHKEQELVEVAKARAKALVEQFRTPAGARAVEQKAIEATHRDETRGFSSRNTDEKSEGREEPFNESVKTTRDEDHKDDLPTFKGKKRKF